MRRLKSLLFLNNVLKELFYVDLRSLALLRVAVAITLLIDLFIRSQYVIEHYTDSGILPRYYLMGENWNFSIHFISGIWQVQAVLLLIQAIFAVMLLVGYRTKLATIVSWLLLVSLHARNPVINNGSDVLLRMILFWGMFLPWQARYSIDSFKNSALLKLPSKVFSIGILGYFFQVSFLYFFSAILKSGAEWTSQGTAVYYALNIDQFATPIAHILLQFPSLLTFLTFAVWYFELLVPLLLFSPMYTPYVRLLTIISLIFMHVSFGASLLIGLFPLIASVSLLGLIPSIVWDTVFRFLEKNKNTKITIFYDGKCGFCKGITFSIKTFFLLPNSKISPAQTDSALWDEMNRENSWIVLDSHGKHYYKAYAFPVIAQASPFFFFLAPFLNFTPVLWIANKFYEYLALHRQKYCLLQEETHTHKRIWELSITANLLATIFLCYIVVYNISTLPNSGVYIKPEFESFGHFLKIDQKWNMFAPYPLKDDGWYVIPGTLADGSVVDLLSGKDRVSWERPDWIAIQYKDSRWRKYFMNLYSKSFSSNRSFYAQFLCNSWNRKNINLAKRLVKIEIVFMLERTPPPGKKNAIQKMSLLEYTCP